MRYSIGALLIVTVAAAAAIGYGARAARHIQTLIQDGDNARVAAILVIALLAIVPLAFIFAVRLGRLAVSEPRSRPKKTEVADDETRPVT